MKSITRFVPVCFFALITVWVYSSPALSVTINLQAKPASYGGSCPITINFKATLSVNQACALNCRLVRNDGWKSPIQSVTFPGAQSLAVDFPLTVSASFSGWAAVEAVPANGLKNSALRNSSPPATYISNKINLSILCQSKIVPPVIYGVDRQWGDEGYQRLALEGHDFGSSQGTKEVRINGQVYPCHAWVDQQVIVCGPPFYHDQTFRIGIYSEGKLISNELVRTFDVFVEVNGLWYGKPGTEIKLRPRSIHADTGDYWFQLGSSKMLVSHWEGTAPILTATVLIPNIPPGDYLVEIYKGGMKIGSSWPLEKIRVQ